MATIYRDQSWRHREVLIVLALAIVSLLLWRAPFVGLLFYPFRLFGVFVHEISHGLAAMITGGEFHRFAVHPNLSGVALAEGGIRWIIVSAGYVGSAIFGGLLVILAARGSPARRVLLGWGVALGLLCLLFVRNLFGIATGLLLSAGLIVAGRRLREEWADGLLLFLAVQMMLDALNSLLDLLLISAARPGVLTDAEIMARATGVPALFWALLWGVIAGVVLYTSLRLAYRQPPPTLRRPASRV